MSLIDEVVRVNIKRGTLGITSAGLNTLLILGNSKKNDESWIIRAKAYSDLAAVQVDYATTTPEYYAAQKAFAQQTRLNQVLIGQCFDQESFADAYPKVVSENNNFYGVVITSKTAEDQLAIAALVETEERIFGLSNDSQDILDPEKTTDIVSQLKALNYTRTFTIYHRSADIIYPEAAWFGLMFGKEAGSATWAYKTLSAVSSSHLTAENRSTISTKNGNYYTTMGDVDVILEGKTAKGEYIDIIQGLDWLSNNIKTRIANVFISSDKVPYTNDGIAIIESMVRNSLNEAVERDIIDQSSIKVSVPDVLAVSPENRVNRILPNVKFEARLVGAIHKVVIQGTVTV